MEGLQFITSNPVRDGRRQAFGEAVARQTFEDSQADRQRAVDDRANKAALDEAYRSIAAGQATGDTMQDQLARSVSAIPGGGAAGLEAIQTRNAAEAARLAAEQERDDLERKRSDKLAELAADRGFQLLDLGAVAEAKASFESAGMKFPEQFYTDRAMQARTEQALPTAKEFYGHDPQNGAKFMASVMQGTSVEQAFQQHPPMAKPPAVTRPNLQPRKIQLSDGSTVEVSGQVVNNVWQPVQDQFGNLGIDADYGMDATKTAEVYRMLGLTPPPGMAPPPEQPEKPGFVSQIWDQITGAGSESQTATAATPQPTWSDAFASGGNAPATTGLAGVNAGQPAPAPAAAPAAAPAPMTPPGNAGGSSQYTVEPEGVRFQNGDFVPVGGAIEIGGTMHIVQSITPDPATGELIVNLGSTGQ